MTELDLTDEPIATSKPLLSIRQAVQPRRPIDDWARISLALILVILLCALTLGSGIYIAVTPSKEQAIEAFLKLVYTPVIGLVGSVVGFYFGSRASSRDR